MSRDRFLTFAQRPALRGGPFPVCALSRLDFALGWEARHFTRPNQVSLVRTGRSPSVAPHLALRRRSYGRLWSMNVRPEGTFHPPAHVRSRAHHPPSAPSPHRDEPAVGRRLLIGGTRERHGQVAFSPRRGEKVPKADEGLLSRNPYRFLNLIVCAMRLPLPSRNALITAVSLTRNDSAFV